MKTLAKKTISIILFLILFAIGLVLLYKVFSWKDTSGDYFSSADQAYSLNDHIVDLAFFGPSVTYASYNPAIFWEQRGIASFNAAVSGQDRNASTYYVKEFLKNQSPKVVVLSSTYFYTDTYAVQGNLYRNALSLNPSINSIKLIRNIVPKASLPTKQNLWNYYLRWPILHSRYRELKRGDFLPVKEYEYSMGYIYDYGSWSQESFGPSATDQNESMPVNSQIMSWIGELKALGEQNGFEILVVAAPSDLSAGERACLNGCFEYLDSIGIAYLDMNQVLNEMDFLPAEDMVDSIHANVNGATKISSYLCDYVAERFSLPDRRSEKGYEIYEQSLSVYQHHALEKAILPYLDSVGFAQLLAENESLIYSVTLHQEGEMAQEITDLLAEAGVAQSDMINGGTWILRGKTVLCSPKAKPYGHQVNKSEFFYVTPDPLRKGADTVSFGKSDLITAQNTDCCIVTYDMVLDRVIDVREIH
ncbi:MAG: hypothetical protein J6Z22_01500 [Lachnospiraceae bacterium]|nr:hypothetical protein [Lachnospiraceae bacterium]